MRKSNLNQHPAEGLEITIYYVHRHFSEEKKAEIFNPVSEFPSGKNVIKSVTQKSQNCFILILIKQINGLLLYIGFVCSGSKNDKDKLIIYLKI